MTDIFTDKGLKLLLLTFVGGFGIGLAIGIIGFVLVVDAMAK